MKENDEEGIKRKPKPGLETFLIYAYTIKRETADMFLQL